MTINKTKLFIPSHNSLCVVFLLLTFGFVFLFAQNSFAYTDTTNHCATFKDGSFVQPNGLSQDQYCIFDKTDIPNWTNYYNEIGLSLDSVKIPYSFAIQLWKTINTASIDRSYLASIAGDISTCQKDKGEGFLLDYYQINTSSLFSYFLPAKIYDETKTEIIRSCLPGIIETSTLFDARKYKCWVNNYKPPRDVYGTFYPNNYTDFSFTGCGLNDEGSMSLSSNAKFNPISNRLEVLGESFILNWNLSNPSGSCTLSGTNATNPSETFQKEIKAGEVGINVRTGQITPKSDSFIFNYAKEGIYTYTFSCAGVLDGKNSSTRGVISKSIKIYVGNIPPSPIINTFDIVQSEDLKNVPENLASSADYQLPINKSFQLKWDVSNADKSAGARPVKIWRQKGIGKSVLLSTNTLNNIGNPQTIKFSDADVTGIYTFWLEVVGEKYPELTTESPNKIRIRAWSASKPDVPEGEFSADKKEIEKNESVILSWNISSASSISIDHEIGTVSRTGNITVNPIVTTTYTLTAKNPVAGNPDTKKIVTIIVKSPIIGATELKEFIPPEATEIGEQEGTPSEKKVIDLKVNKIDGPITLKAPATFTLSWNLDTYCLATGSWLSIKTKAGNETISLNKNGKYTYTLYCPGGYGSDSVTINVVNSNVNGLLNAVLGNGGGSGVANMPIAEASASTDLINYSQDIKVIQGEPTNIYVKINKDINNDNQVSHDASGFWSELMTNGGYCLYNNNLERGAPSFNGMVESPESREDCNVKLGTFTFNDEPGTYKYGIFRILQNDRKFSNISYINIIVENPPAPTSAPVIDLKINGNNAIEQILGTPANFNVSWSVANADTCEASGSWSGLKDLNGIQSFVSSFKKDFIYILTCTGKLGISTKSISLKVAEAPTCSFTALPPSINKKSSFVTDSELSWKCDYADACSLSPNLNTTINTYGTLRVSPDQTTTYILTCNNSEVSKSFEAKVEVIN